MDLKEDKDELEEFCTTAKSFTFKAICMHMTAIFAHMSDSYRSHSVYSRAVFISLATFNGAVFIQGWCLFEEIQ